MTNLGNTVAEVEAAIEREEAEYQTAKATHQDESKYLKALLKVVTAREGIQPATEATVD